MAYNDDAVLAKLSSLNETHDSIVTVSQWIMFHRRYADQTAQLFMTKLKGASGTKRIALLYLVNEIVQQSKARRKEDFLIAFSPVIAEATAIAYKGSNSDVQEKIRRVVEVWRARQVFDEAIQSSIERRVDEIDKQKSAGAKRPMGGSIFSSSANSSAVPPELTPLVAPLSALTKSALTTRTSVTTANTEYEKHTDPAAVIPSAPVHAARLNGLLKVLATAEGAVAERVKTRKTLIEGLEKLLASNRAALTEDENQVAVLAERKQCIDTKKRDVEDSIMRGYANSNPNTPTLHNASPGANAGANATPNTLVADLDRPQFEELTPPPFEALTPVGSPKHELSNDDSDMTMGGEMSKADNSIMHNTAIPSHSSLPPAQSGYGASHSGTLKKRKLGDDEFPDLGVDDNLGLDAETAEMLRKG